MTQTIKNLFLSKLAADPAQPFDGMAAGDFVDMYGRPARIPRDDLAAYVVNTQANILATADASGAVVGLPIDWMNHNHGEAAGWITGVSLAEGRDVILFAPRWNELGRALIESDAVRYFSPEFDPRAKVIMGGSLTNWPATRTREQKILLRPIALSQALSSVSIDESLDERIANVRGAFREFTGSWFVYAVEVFDDYLICRDDDEDKMYRVGYVDNGSGFAFEDRAAWTEVKQTYIEAAMQKLEAAMDFLKRVFSGRDGDPVDEPPGETTNQPEDDMAFDVSKLTADERRAILAQLTTSGDDLPTELATLIDLKANERMSALLAVEQRKRDTLALASGLVGGTPERPRGLPVDKTELADLLLSLSPEQAEKASAILATIQEKGVIEFAELGHSRELTGVQKLPVEISAKLDSGQLSLADLSSPILALGDLAQYDLSAWKEK